MQNKHFPVMNLACYWLLLSEIFTPGHAAACQLLPTWVHLFLLSIMQTTCYGDNLKTGTTLPQFSSSVVWGSGSVERNCFLSSPMQRIGQIIAFNVWGEEWRWSSGRKVRHDQNFYDNCQNSLPNCIPLKLPSPMLMSSNGQLACLFSVMTHFYAHGAIGRVTTSWWHSSFGIHAFLPGTRFLPQF